MINIHCKHGPRGDKAGEMIVFLVPPPNPRPWSRTVQSSARAWRLYSFQHSAQAHLPLLAGRKHRLSQQAQCHRTRKDLDTELGETKKPLWPMYHPWEAGWGCHLVSLQILCSFPLTRSSWSDTSQPPSLSPSIISELGAKLGRMGD